MGMCYTSDIETGESDVTIHRLCLQSKDEISMFFTPGARHLGVFREKAEKLGNPLPSSISIGVDSAIEIASCLDPSNSPDYSPSTIDKGNAYILFMDYVYSLK